MFLSIIVPAYNVEKFLKRCIDSIYNQKNYLREFEVIIVNDGSNDSTGKIADELVNTKEYFNLQVIHQENQGLSGARNTGINYAEGDYIWFIDSDDWIRSHGLSELKESTMSNKPDLIFFRLLSKKLNGEEHIDVTQPFPRNTLLNGKDVILGNYVPCSACSAWFKSKFIKEMNLSFFPKLFHQDVEFMYRVVALARNIVFTDYFPYIYEAHYNTISTSNDITKKIKRLVDNGIIANSFLKFAQNISDKKLRDRIELQAESIVRGTIYSLWRDKRHIEKSSTDEVIRRFREFGLFPLINRQWNIKKMIITYFLNFKFYKFGN